MSEDDRTRLARYRRTLRYLPWPTGLTIVAMALDGLGGFSGYRSFLTYVTSILTLMIGYFILNHRMMKLVDRSVATVSSSAEDGPEAPQGSLKTPRSHRKWPLAAGVIAGTNTALVLVAWALVNAGLGNAYSIEVVDQRAQSATVHAEFAGTYDIAYTDDALCGGGEDYRTCVEMHRIMYNTACTDRWVTLSGEALCDSLLEFISDTQTQYANCGYDCRTEAGTDGIWGWRQVRPVAATIPVSNGDSLPMISHAEHCYFALGSIKIGTCPR